MDPTSTTVHAPGDARLPVHAAAKTSGHRLPRRVGSERPTNGRRVCCPPATKGAYEDRATRSEGRVTGLA